MAVIEIDGLVKRFGGIEAVRDLSFTVEPGRVTGFLGPNGAGKSTTLKALLGLVQPTAGSATFGGRPYHRLERPSATVGAVLEEASFHPGRTGRNHLRVLAAAGDHPKGRVDEVLELVGLTDAARRRVKGYSMGMRQRLGIAAALLGDPRVLVLDEPANGLDPPGIRWLRDLLRQQAREGRTVLVSSHLLAEVAQGVDDVVVIARGELRARGTLDEVLGGADRATVVRSRDVGSLAEALVARRLRVEHTGPDELVVHQTAPDVVGDVAAEHRIALSHLTGRTRSLEDAFLELTSDEPPP
ncbi:MAG: ATP-binding cassette domain-containing protein, partial [Actinomycetota bacterium]|nr:ATP-binding cassette domain-containing protein [Actinomycetota bacterium]